MVNYTSADSLVAKKYAKAFIRVFGKDLSYADLALIEAAQKFLLFHRRTLFFLQLPQFDTKTKHSMIEDLVGYFRLPHQFFKLFVLLITHGRSFFIPTVLEHVIQGYKNYSRVVSFSIMSSHHLDENNQKKIKNFLEHSTGKTIMCSYSVNRWLIAGIRMQSVDYIWEYSVRKQLDCLRSLAK